MTLPSLISLSLTECEINDFTFSYSFVFDKFFYKLCLIRVKEKINKEKGTVSVIDDADDLLQNVSPYSIRNSSILMTSFSA
jgi:hypothetical protein